MKPKNGRGILNKLVVPQLPFPLSVSKDFGLKCAKRAKKEIEQSLQSLCDLINVKELTNVLIDAGMSKTLPAPKTPCCKAGWTYYTAKTYPYESGIKCVKCDNEYSDLELARAGIDLYPYHTPTYEERAIALKKFIDGKIKGDKKING